VATYPNVVLIGGATALVGDPTAQTESRPFVNPEVLAANATALEVMVRHLVREATIVNNAEWFGNLTLMDSAGQKIVKTTGGAVWIDGGRTRPFTFHQFSLNAEDAVVGDML